MFLKDEEGHDGPEMQFVWSVTGISFFAGVVFGAYSHGSREAIQSNKYFLDFLLEKPLEFWLEIPYTNKKFKNG